MNSAGNRSLRVENSCRARAQRRGAEPLGMTGHSGAAARCEQGWVPPSFMIASSYAPADSEGLEARTAGSCPRHAAGCRSPRSVPLQAGRKASPCPSRPHLPQLDVGRPQLQDALADPHRQGARPHRLALWRHAARVRPRLLAAKGAKGWEVGWGCIQLGSGGWQQRGAHKLGPARSPADREAAPI